MGCASSKPSSSSKNKKKDSSSNTSNNATKHQKSKDAAKSNATKDKSTGNELDELIKIDRKLLSQIDQHRGDVVNYIVGLVRRDLNAELVANGNHSKGGNMANLATAALSAPDNDSLIAEAANQALSLIKNGKCDTYKSLADSLKASSFVAKNQTNKPRVCYLTADTIRRCLNDIYSHGNTADFNLLSYLAGHDVKQLTPPATPQKVDAQKNALSADTNSPNEFGESILLSRAEANKVARILFLTNRARPVIHASQKKKGAYFVNIQQDDNSEIPATRQQIEEIISFSAANRHHDQPSIYEVAETFLNTSSAEVLKLSPAWLTSASTPTHSRLASSPPVSPVQVHLEHLQASSFDTPQTPVAAGRRDDLVEASVESTPRSAAADTSVTTNEHELSSLNETPANLTSATSNTNDETIETDPHAGDESMSNDEARLQLGVAANLIMLASNLAAEANVEEEATVPNGVADESIVIDEPSDANTSSNQVAEESNSSVPEPALSVQESEGQVPSSESEPINVDQSNQEPVVDQAESPEVQPSSENTQQQSVSSEGTEDLKKIEAAATTIQATYRGYKTRKQFKTARSGSTEQAMSDNNSLADNSSNAAELAAEVTAEQLGTSNNEAQPEAAATSPTSSDDLNDEVNEEQAVVKIQAAYRGFRTRKELKSNDQSTTKPQEPQAGAGEPEKPNTNTNNK